MNKEEEEGKKKQQQSPVALFTETTSVIPDCLEMSNTM